MTIERERKYRIDVAAAELIRSCAAARGLPARRETQLNVIFDGTAPEVLLRLRERVGVTARELTVKVTRARRGDDKEREEINVQVCDGPIEDLLCALGYRALVKYAKDTTIFTAEDALISIDSVEGIGRFCELEATRLDTDLARLAHEFGLQVSQLEARSYPELVAARSQETG